MERYCELANKTTQQLYKVSTPCIDDHHFKEEEMKSVGELSQVCSQIVPKSLYLARIGRPYILCSVNKLQRSITKWTKACDKRLNRLISYIYHTCEYKQYCHVGNTSKQCRLGLFQDSDFAGVLGNTTQTTERPGRPVIIDKSQRSQGMTNVLNNIDCVPSNVQSSHQEALLHVFEDNEAVIKMIIKGRSPTMRHVSRTHRLARDWLFDRINLDSKNPNQVHRHQKPTRRHLNQREFHM